MQETSPTFLVVLGLDFLASQNVLRVLGPPYLKTGSRARVMLKKIGRWLCTSLRGLCCCCGCHSEEKPEPSLVTMKTWQSTHITTIVTVPSDAPPTSGTRNLGRFVSDGSVDGANDLLVVSSRNSSTSGTLLQPSEPSHLPSQQDVQVRAEPDKMELAIQPEMPNAHQTEATVLATLSTEKVDLDSDSARLSPFLHNSEERSPHRVATQDWISDGQDIRQCAADQPERMLPMERPHSEVEKEDGQSVQLIQERLPRKRVMAEGENGFKALPNVSERGALVIEDDLPLRTVGGPGRQPRMRVRMTAGTIGDGAWDPHTTEHGLPEAKDDQPMPTAAERLPRKRVTMEGIGAGLQLSDSHIHGGFPRRKSERGPGSGVH